MTAALRYDRGLWTKCGELPPVTQHHFKRAVAAFYVVLLKSTRAHEVLACVPQCCHIRSLQSCPDRLRDHWRIIAREVAQSSRRSERYFPSMELFFLRDTAVVEGPWQVVRTICVYRHLDIVVATAVVKGNDAVSPCPARVLCWSNHLPQSAPLNFAP